MLSLDQASQTLRDLERGVIQMLSLDQFRQLLRGGRGRFKPEKAVSFVLIENEDEEEFYAEWEYVDEEEDEVMVEAAFHEYKIGESTVIYVQNTYTLLF